MTATLEYNKWGKWRYNQNGNFSDLVIVSKDFDCLDHGLVVRKLSSHRIPDTALSWFKSSLEVSRISAPLLERSGAALRDSRNSSSSNLIYSYNYSLGASVELSAVAYNLLTNQNKPVSVSVGVLT
ncbi:hypothetical protein J6590_002092 [Homalodisca vitripennis]|nr:hypothetical protein J6590_002092 [Homalodisca vitripennis]